MQVDLAQAIALIKRGEVVAIPTETVYGLAADARNEGALKQIFAIKQRPTNNPLIVHYYNVNKLKEDCYINDNFIKLYNKFSPGPITFILKLKKYSSELSVESIKNINQILVW